MNENHSIINDASSYEDTLSDFDLESYISRYDQESETRLQRLLFIANRTSQKPIMQDDHEMEITTKESKQTNAVVPNLYNPSIASTAYQLAITQLKANGNVQKYNEIFGKTETMQGNESSNSTDFDHDLDGNNVNQQGGDFEDAMDSKPNSRHPHSSPSTDPTRTSSTTHSTFPPSTAISIEKLTGLTYDDEWTQKTAHNQQIQLETLESRLSSAQAHLNKDAIRTAFLALYDFFRRQGKYKQAMNYLVHARDYCIGNAAINSICLDIATLAIDMEDWVKVYTSVNFSTIASSKDSINTRTLAKIDCIVALEHMEKGRYKDAALKFASITPDLGTTTLSTNNTNLQSQLHNVIVPEDIALYGTILGLASLDRTTLRTMIFESNIFQQRLELVPKLRDSLRCFERAEYGRGLLLLTSFQPEMRLDIHLSSHVDTLFSQITERCMVQYFYPYSSISLETMAKAFHLSTQEVEEAVEKLILDGKIRGAKINGKDGTLARRVGIVEQRRRLLRKVKKMGDRFVGDAESMMLRLSCLEQDFIVQSDRFQKLKDTRSNKSYENNLLRSGNSTMFEDGSSEEEDVVMMDM